MSDKPGRLSLLGIIGGLMLAENMGDVHDEINLLCDLVGIAQPEDWERVGLESDE